MKIIFFTFTIRYIQYNIEEKWYDIVDRIYRKKNILKISMFEKKQSTEIL